MTWDLILFAWGDMSKWIIFKRTVFEAFIAAADCESCKVDIYKTSDPESKDEAT